MENVTQKGVLDNVEFVPKHFRILNSVILITITLVGIFGNTLIFIAYCLSRRLRTKTNIFVINLAVADILTCVCLPVVAFSLLVDVNVDTRSWLDTVCGIDFGATQIFVCSSFLTLAFIAVNRYVLITKSQETYKWLYQRKFILIFISISWLYPTLFVTLPLLFDIGYIGYDENMHACGALTDHPRSYLYDMIIVSNGTLPIAMIVYSYGQIYLFLKRHNKQMQEGRVSGTSSKLFRYVPNVLRSVRNAEKMNEGGVSRNQVDITKNLFYILVSFFICLTPHMISEVLDAHYLVISYTKLIITFNSCVNPILYGIKHPYFRQVFYSILSRRWDEIPEPAFRWMNSGSSFSAVTVSRSRDLDSTSMAVSWKIDTM
ncbi:Melanopsin [Holothuria leucospilota]|uniref:Melanopsin n=1 Tax=Holothuria leucospilota TaxID=206669 RepID=A0A9Q1BF77_HOLLE|nr:Melanopsin [Holothuria leucospilota]